MTRPVRTGIYTDDFVDLIKRNARDSAQVSVWMHRRGAAYGTLAEHLTLVFGDPKAGAHYSVPWPMIPAEHTYMWIDEYGNPDPDSPILEIGWPVLLDQLKPWLVDDSEEIDDLLGV